MKSQEYKKYEFCKAFNCRSFADNKCKSVTDSMCRMTAKEFYKYLEAQKYKIISEKTTTGKEIAVQRKLCPDCANLVKGEK